MSVSVQSGASLLEVVVATFLLAVSVSGLAALYSQSVRVLQQAQQLQAAVLLSADYWELAPAYGPVANLPNTDSGLSCVLAKAWQQPDGLQLWQHRRHCALPQASVRLRTTAQGSALFWQGLFLADNRAWVIGVE